MSDQSEFLQMLIFFDKDTYVGGSRCQPQARTEPWPQLQPLTLPGDPAPEPAPASATPPQGHAQTNCSRKHEAIPQDKTNNHKHVDSCYFSTEPSQWTTSVVSSRIEHRTALGRNQDNPRIDLTQRG